MGVSGGMTGEMGVVGGMAGEERVVGEMTGVRVLAVCVPETERSVSECEACELGEGVRVLARPCVVTPLLCTLAATEFSSNSNG